jgi:hypothetical protein
LRRGRLEACLSTLSSFLTMEVSKQDTEPVRFESLSRHK